MSEKRKYDSTVARIAGNILGGFVTTESPRLTPGSAKDLAEEAVLLARAIVEEVQRTEPDTEPARPARETR